MATLDYNGIWQAAYTLFRADSDVPAATDDEYTVGMRLANEAINYWSGFDSTYWKELYTTAQGNSTGGVVTITTGTKTYACPTAFREAGGFVRVQDANGNDQARYPIIDSHEAQFKGSKDSYCFFTGGPIGWTLNLNPAPPSSLNGLNIDYVYYKYPTLFTTGTDVTELSEPYYIVHRILANLFRASRNPYYASALRDSESAIKTMKLDNEGGTWANAPYMYDRSNSVFGG